MIFEIDSVLDLGLGGAVEVFVHWVSESFRWWSWVFGFGQKIFSL